MHGRTCAILVSIVTMFVLASAARGNATLSLRRLPGPGITVAVSISNLGADRAAGYQAFLEYDPAVMQFVSGEYVTDQIGLVLTGPVTAQGSRITLAAGINPFSGQQPTGSDSDLVVLTFEPAGAGCEAAIRFRDDAQPPTRLTDINGVAIPVGLRSLWPACRADYNADGVLGVQDIFDFLSGWFAGSCQSDYDHSGVLGVQDIFDFLAGWFAGCA
jgi:hypothetical protein